MGVYKAAFSADVLRPVLWKGAVINTLPALAAMVMGVETALPLVLTVSAILGSWAFTADYRSGSFHRRVLLFQRVPAWTARGASCALAAILSGGVAGVGAGLPAALALAGAAGMGALWGFGFGSLIRSHMVSLFAVPLTLTVPRILLGPEGQYSQFVFPVLAADWAQQAAVNIPASGSFFGAVGWLVLVTAAALTVFTKRDLR